MVSRTAREREEASVGRVGNISCFLVVLVLVGFWFGLGWFGFWFSFLVFVFVECSW